MPSRSIASSRISKARQAAWASSPWQKRPVQQGRRSLHKWGITPTQLGGYHQS